MRFLRLQYLSGVMVTTRIGKVWLNDQKSRRVARLASLGELSFRDFRGLELTFHGLKTIPSSSLISLGPLLGPGGPLTRIGGGAGFRLMAIIYACLIQGCSILLEESILELILNQNMKIDSLKKLELMNQFCKNRIKKPYKN